MRITLFLSILFFCANSVAQSKLQTKDFIIKNYDALNLIHQEIIGNKNLLNEDVFKLLLQKQLVCVKLYNDGNNQAISYAFDLRNNCINLIKNFIKKSEVPYLITVAEKNYQITDIKFDKNLLPTESLKSIKDLNIFDKNALNKYTLSVQ